VAAKSRKAPRGSGRSGAIGEDDGARVEALKGGERCRARHVEGEDAELVHATGDEVARFCEARAGSGSGAVGGGTGPVDLRDRRLAGRRDQGGADLRR
jgi:hypothetical protein